LGGVTKSGTLVGVISKIVSHGVWCLRQNSATFLEITPSQRGTSALAV
jgi:hypothetical protein